MPDRKPSLILWLLVPLLAFLGIVYFLPGPRDCDWVFIYYMSYDNDLSSYGNTILRDLQKGVVNSKIAVTIQADLADGGGMKRITLFHENGKPKKKEVALGSEDSADETQLRKYLEWVRKNWNAENYCIVFLNHGGTLDHICQDRKPFRDSGKNKKFVSGKWLRASKAARILATFNRKADNKVRLLFLQQCGRAAIQNLYSFVDSGEYIMASPMRVDAPNTYYTKTLTLVGQDPNVTVETLADTIMREDEHYTVYTLIDNDRLRELPERLAPVLEAFEAAPTLNQPKSCPAIFSFEGEQFYDLKSYFQALSLANGNVAGTELGDLFFWCENQLVVRKSVRASATAESSYCGLSIYVPSSGGSNKCYDALPLYQQTNLDSVMKRSP